MSQIGGAPFIKDFEGEPEQLITPKNFGINENGDGSDDSFNEDSIQEGEEAHVE